MMTHSIFFMVHSFHGFTVSVHLVLLGAAGFGRGTAFHCLHAVTLRR
jgi:hypothetical protein